MSFPPEIERYISEKRCDESLVSLLRELSSVDHTHIQDLIKELDPSANNLRQLLSLAADISLRDGIPISNVLGAPNFCEAVSSSGSRKQRFAKAKASLERSRYPLKSFLEAELTSCIEQIRRDLSLEIELPPNLEGLRLRVSATVGSDQDLREVSSKIAELVVHPAYCKLNALLRGEQL